MFEVEAVRGCQTGAQEREREDGFGSPSYEDCP